LLLRPLLPWSLLLTWHGRRRCGRRRSGREWRVRCAEAALELDAVTVEREGQPVAAAQPALRTGGQIDPVGARAIAQRQPDLHCMHVKAACARGDDRRDAAAEHRLRARRRVKRHTNACHADETG
jgi:hypothetical protein